MATYCVLDAAVWGAYDKMENPIDTGHSWSRGRQTIITQTMITCDQNADGNPQGGGMEGTGWGSGGGGGGDVHLHRVPGKASLKR